MRGIAKSRGKGIETLRVGCFQGEECESRALVIASAGAGAMPDIGCNMMVIAARREEACAVTAAGHVEAEGVPIESLRTRDIPDAQVHMPDTQAIRCLGKFC